MLPMEDMFIQVNRMFRGRILKSTSSRVFQIIVYGNFISFQKNPVKIYISLCNNNVIWMTGI